jgi:hypothetical protein
MLVTFMYEYYRQEDICAYIYGHFNEIDRKMVSRNVQILQNHVNETMKSQQKKICLSIYGFGDIERRNAVLHVLEHIFESDIVICSNQLPSRWEALIQCCFINEVGIEKLEAVCDLFCLSIGVIILTDNDYKSIQVCTNRIVDGIDFYVNTSGKSSYLNLTQISRFKDNPRHMVNILQIINSIMPRLIEIIEIICTEKNENIHNTHRRLSIISDHLNCIKTIQCSIKIMLEDPMQAWISLSVYIERCVNLTNESSAIIDRICPLTMECLYIGDSERAPFISDAIDGMFWLQQQFRNIRTSLLSIE